MMASVDRTRGDGCLSDLVLDRLLANELADVPEGQLAREHLAGCESCALRHATLRTEAAQFPQAVDIVAAASATAGATAPKRTRRWGVGAAAIAATAAAAIVILPRRQADDRAPGVRSKGGLSLSVVARHRDGEIEQLLPGANVVAGDELRFQVSTEEAGFVGIVGVDATRTATPYFPTSGQLAPLPVGRDQLLDGAIALDGHGDERFVVVACAKRLSIEAIAEAARVTTSLPGNTPRQLPPLAVACRQDSFLVHKK
jgi:hypothetical protein